MAGIPRSVRAIDKGPPYGLARFAYGMKLHQAIEFFREMWDHLDAAGDYVALANELRTKVHTGGDVFALLNELRLKVHTAGDVFALLNEMRTKLTTGGAVFALLNELRSRVHTGGDYRLIVSGIRARLVSGGIYADRLMDLEDKVYNYCLTDPGWRRDPGAPRLFSNANAINAIVNGVYTAGLYAPNIKLQIDAGANTGPAEYRAVTLSLTAAGELVQTISAAGSTPPTPPRPPSGNVPVGVIQIPPDFTTLVTIVQPSWFTQGFPRRLAVHAPITHPDVAAISAADVPAMTAGAVGAVAAAAVGAVVAAEVTAPVATKPESFPDIDG